MLSSGTDLILLELMVTLRVEVVWEVTDGSLKLTVTCPKSQSRDSAEPGLVVVHMTQLGPVAPHGLGVI